MKNKYLNVLNNMEINADVKRQILNKIDKPKKIFKLSYAICLLSMILLTFTYVSANEIIKKWGGIKRETENNQFVLEPERSYITTSYDDFEINEAIDSNLMNSNEIKEKLKINFLSLENKYYLDSVINSSYTLWQYAPSYNNKVQNITITQYGDGLNLTAYGITKNFPIEEMDKFNQDIVYDYKNLIYVDTVFIENLGIDAQIYTRTISKNAKSFERYHIEFSYKNIKYILSSTMERTLEEMLEVLSTMKK